MGKSDTVNRLKGFGAVICCFVGALSPSGGGGGGGRDQQRPSSALSEATSSFSASARGASAHAGDLSSPSFAPGVGSGVLL